MPCSQCDYPTHVCYDCGAWYVCQPVSNGLTNVREFMGQGMGEDQRAGEWHMDGFVCPDCNKALVPWNCFTQEEADG